MNAIKIKSEYLEWIKETYKFKDIVNDFSPDKIIEFLSPSLDNFGDSISFLIKEQDGKLIITDDGFTLWNLKSHGIDITRKSSKRNKLLKSLLRYYRVNYNDKNNSIYIETTPQKLSQSIHEMNEILIKINDLSILHSSNIKSLFQEDVLEYFNNNKDIYSFFPDFLVAGKSKILYNMDFLFNTNDGQKMVQIHNHINQQTIKSILVSWLDTIEFRQKQYQEDSKLSIITSGEKKVSQENLEALNAYNIDVLNFDEKDRLKEKLGA